MAVPTRSVLDINAVYSVNANLSDLDESFLQDRTPTDKCSRCMLFSKSRAACSSRYRLRPWVSDAHTGRIPEVARYRELPTT